MMLRCCSPVVPFAVVFVARFRLALRFAFSISCSSLTRRRSIRCAAASMSSRRARSRAVPGLTGPFGTGQSSGMVDMSIFGSDGNRGSILMRKRRPAPIGAREERCR